MKPYNLRTNNKGKLTSLKKFSIFFILYEQQFQIINFISCNLMGTGHSQSVGDIFRREDWELVESKQAVKTWANRRDINFRVEQYDIFSEDQGKFNREERIYYFRKNSNCLVASLYRQCQDQGSFCSTNYRQTLFIECIPIRLSDIQHIPYPDSLHLLSQSLLGFHQLANEVGFFPIEQEYIGVNNDGVVKVWMNDHYEKSFVQGVRVHEEAMVRSIIDIIDKNVDQAQIPSVRSYLYRNSSAIKFNQAIAELNQYVRQFNRGQIPHKLDCIDRVGGIYAIVNRQQGGNNRSQLQIQRNYTQISSKPVQQNMPIPLIYNGINIQSHPVQPIIKQSQQINHNLAVKQQRFIPMRTSEIIGEEKITQPSIFRQNLPIVRNSRIPDIRPMQMIDGQHSTRGSQIINQYIPPHLTQSSHQNNHLGSVTLHNQAKARNQTIQIPIETIKISHSHSQQKKIVFQHPRPLSYHPQGHPTSLIQTKQNQIPFGQIIQPSVKDAILIRGAPIGSAVTSSAKSSQIHETNSGSGTLQTNVMITNFGLNPPSNRNNAQKIVNNMINVINNQQQPIILQKSTGGAQMHTLMKNVDKQYPSPQRNQFKQNFISQPLPISQINSTQNENRKQIGCQNTLVAVQQKQPTPVNDKFKLSIDDGKSSDQFLKKLKGMSSISGEIKSSPIQSAQFRNAFENIQKNSSPQVRNKNEQSQYLNKIQRKQLSPSQNLLKQQIGGNLVSNLLGSQPQFTNNSRELSVESTQNQQSNNLTNSAFNSESPPPYKYKYSSLNYQPTYDPQLMEDINKMRFDS